MRWSGLAYRAHDPRWAWAPLSGEGAAAQGGRFNPKGVPALYLALTLEGVFLEMSHGFGHRFEPLTMCTYDVDVDDVVDLSSDATRAAANAQGTDMACAWAYDRDQGRKPASWALVEKLIGHGAAGILTPSFARGARPDMLNLVLWRWGTEVPHKVTLFDPNNRLLRG